MAPDTANKKAARSAKTPAMSKRKPVMKSRTTQRSDATPLLDAITAG
jgi:hypothetical protein